MSLGSFLGLMLPYTLASLVLILIWSTVQTRGCDGPIEVAFAEKVRLSDKKAQLAAYLLLFVLALLTVARVLPCGLTLVLTAAGLLLADLAVVLVCLAMEAASAW